MPGIGTGFDKDINKNLLGTLKACYKGLLEMVDEGKVSPAQGLGMELEEIGEYHGVISSEEDRFNNVKHQFLHFLSACYTDLQHHQRGDLRKTVEEQIGALEESILRTEKGHKKEYKHIWSRID